MLVCTFLKEYRVSAAHAKVQEGKNKITTEVECACATCLLSSPAQAAMTSTNIIAPVHLKVLFLTVMVIITICTEFEVVFCCSCYGCLHAKMPMFSIQRPPPHHYYAYYPHRSATKSSAIVSGFPTWYLWAWSKPRFIFTCPTYGTNLLPNVGATCVNKIVFLVRKWSYNRVSFSSPQYMFDVPCYCSCHGYLHANV